MAVSSSNIIDFWFNEITPKQWFEKSSTFDQMIIDRFSGVHQAAAQGELYGWRSDAEGCLAEIIILDQFSRNMFRDQALSFAYDGMALILAQRAVELKTDHELPPVQRSFMYMPYMHSESSVIHQQAVKLFDQSGLENNLQFEYRHKEIVDRYGRYPHRNAVLNRVSTTDELNFLESPGSSF